MVLSSYRNKPLSNPDAAQGRAARLPAALRPMAAYGVIIFSLALLIGNYAGTTYRFWTLATARETAIHLHRERLGHCIFDEYRINAARAELAMPPLPSTAFYPATTPN